MSRFPIATLWRANLDGVDLAPPLYTLITHVLQWTGGPDVIVTRLTAMAGFLAAAVLLFLTVSRRTNAILGGLAVLLLCAMPAWDYAVEARGYGLSLAFFALALYSWTEAAAGRRATLHWTVMAFALTAEVWTHYYAALIFLPIVIGEIVRQVRLRQFQDAPWLALTCAGLGVLPVWKLITVAAAHRHTFWAQTGTRLRVLCLVFKDLPRTRSVAAVGLLSRAAVAPGSALGASARRTTSPPPSPPAIPRRACSDG
jgi:hypothetical protein